MRAALANRVAQLENRRSKQRANRTLLYNPSHPSGADAVRNVGMPGKYMLVADFGSADEWESALQRQQRALIQGAKQRK